MKGKIISNTIKKFIVAMLSTALVLGAFPANQSVKKASADEVVNSEEFEADKEGKVEIEKDSIIIPAPGHDYGEPTYEWALDGSVCTACAVCKRDSDHKLIECVKATGVLKTEPTEESMGVTTYTANFENELFETQTIDIEDIPKLEKETPSPKPADSTAEPADSTAEPADSTAEPADSTAEPADSTAEPADSTAEPADTAEPEKPGEDDTESTPAPSGESGNSLGIPTPTGYTAPPIPSATPATTKSQASSSAAVTSKTETSAPKKFVVGDSFSVAGIKYVVTSADSDNYEVEATGCSSETVSVMIPDTVTYEGISANVTAVGANAFAGNKVIKKVIIGKNVKSIGAKAFYGCNKLKNVIIKTSLLSKKTIGKNAFKGINAKAKVKVPKKCFKKYKSILKKRGVKGANRKVVK